MAERWYHYYDGSDANDGLSPEAPRKLIPGQVGATTVSAGDIINVRNGVDFSGGGRITPTQDNLLYRGYGMADNALTIQVPVRGAPWRNRSIRCVREAGVHEGMWFFDGSAIDADGSINTGAKNGVVIEDLQLRGSQIGSRNGITLSNSGGNADGFTLRRFEIVGAAGRGITGNTKNLLIEYGRISHTKDDNIGLVSWAANGYRLGSKDVLRYLELIEPNRITEGAPDMGSAGDHLHLQPADGKWEGSLDADFIRCYKTTDSKQALVSHATHANSVLRFRHWSVGGGGDSQFLVGHIGGRMEFTDIYADNWSTEAMPLFRFDAADVSPPVWAMNTGSVLRIRNVLSKGTTPSFYRSVYAASAHSFDGLIEIDNCTILGTNRDGSTLALFELWSASDLGSFGANFQLRVRNNASDIAGKPQIKIPAAMANDARFQFVGNRFAAGTYQAGATEYPDLATFQAAHSAATGNLDTDPQITAAGIPMSGSPLLTQGADLGPRRDIRGFQGRKFIGAYGPARLVAE